MWYISWSQFFGVRGSCANYCLFEGQPTKRNDDRDLSRTDDNTTASDDDD